MTTLGSCSPHHFESLTRLPCMLHTTISTRCHTFHAESYLLLRGCLLQGADAGPTLHFITRVGGDDDSRVGRRWLKLNRARTRGALHAATQGVKGSRPCATSRLLITLCFTVKNTQNKQRFWDFYICATLIEHYAKVMFYVVCN